MGLYLTSPSKKKLHPALSTYSNWWIQGEGETGNCPSKSPDFCRFSLKKSDFTIFGPVTPLPTVGLDPTLPPAATYTLYIPGLSLQSYENNCWKVENNREIQTMPGIRLGTV